MLVSKFDFDLAFLLMLSSTTLIVRSMSLLGSGSLSHKIKKNLIAVLSLELSLMPSLSKAIYSISYQNVIIY